MKIRELRQLIEREASNDIQLSEFLSALSKFDDVSVSMVAGKIAKMKLPKVDPDEAARRLKSFFHDSKAFEELLDSMKSNRDYTKDVFFVAHSTLFPRRKSPAKATKRDELVERIRIDRRRDENLATN